LREIRKRQGQRVGGTWAMLPMESGESGELCAEGFCIPQSTRKWELLENPEFPNLAVSTQLSFYRKLPSTLEILYGINTTLQFYILAYQEADTF
jgi:hypothetical protein